MTRFFSRAVLAFTGTWLFSFSAYVAPAPVAPQVNAKAWILMDYASGNVLAQSNADLRLDPASLTKMMASYVIGQALKTGKIHNDALVSIGTDAWAKGNPQLKGSSLMFLKPGDRVPVSALNKGIVIQSGNDASIALADYIAGSQQAFVDMMNNAASQLGLKNTSFKTVHGLDAPGQYSTARDMALIGQALIRDVPEEYALNKEKEFTFNNIRQHNRNRLLWSTHLQVDGIKTGHTKGAGNNLVASATQGNMRLISVVLGAATDNIRFRETEKLLTWGFRFFETITPLKAQTTLISQRVWFGDRKNVALGVEKDAAFTLAKENITQIKTVINWSRLPLRAPLLKNQAVGSIDFQLNGQTIAQRPLVVLEEVKEGNIFSRIADFILLTLSGWFKSFS